MYGTRKLVHEYLKGFWKYDWLWKDDKEASYKKFTNRRFILNDFESELKKFMSLEAEIDGITATHSIGALMLNMTNLKLQLSNESRSWKMIYSNKVMN
jgi:dynein heavy chain